MYLYYSNLNIKTLEMIPGEISGDVLKEYEVYELLSILGIQTPNHCFIPAITDVNKIKSKHFYPLM
jgi:hypothetical protein